MLNFTMLFGPAFSSDGPKSRVILKIGAKETMLAFNLQVIELMKLRHKK